MLCAVSFNSWGLREPFTFLYSVKMPLGEGVVPSWSVFIFAIGLISLPCYFFCLRIVCIGACLTGVVEQLILERRQEGLKIPHLAPT